MKHNKKTPFLDAILKPKKKASKKGKIGKAAVGGAAIAAVGVAAKKALGNDDVK